MSTRPFKQVTATVSSDLHHLLKSRAAKAGVSMSAYIEDILKERVQRDTRACITTEELSGVTISNLAYKYRMPASDFVRYCFTLGSSNFATSSTDLPKGLHAILVEWAESKTSGRSR